MPLTETSSKGHHRWFACSDEAAGRRSSLGQANVRDYQDADAG